MKNLVKILIIVSILIWYNNTFSFDDYSDSKNNKERAILIEKYLITHKKQISSFTKKYKIEWDYDISKELDKIDFLIKSLRTVQEKNIEKEREDLIINTIVNEIKTVNDRLKVILQEKKNQHEVNLQKIKNSYWLLGEKLSKEVTKITNSLSYIDKKDSYMLSQNEIKIKKSNDRLKELSYLLKIFWKINFSNEEEMKNTFKKIILEIRKEMKNIKNVMN